MKHAPKIFLLFFLAALVLLGEELYRKPPKAVLDVLNAPTTPSLSLSPTRAFAMQGQRLRNPPIAELAEPMLRIAGMRINPKTNGLHNATFNSSLLLRKMPEGAGIPVHLPPNPKLSFAVWNPDGSHYAFSNTTANGIELWIGDTAGRTHRVEGVRLNAVMGGGGRGGGGRFGGGGGGGGGTMQWMPDSKAVLVYTVRANPRRRADSACRTPRPHV